MPYDLIADGKKVDLGNSGTDRSADRGYLLSPQALSGLDVLPELIGIGVSRFKIGGRLKAPEYVANVTRVYHETLERHPITYPWATYPWALTHPLKLVVGFF